MWLGGPWPRFRSCSWCNRFVAWRASACHAMQSPHIGGTGLPGAGLDAQWLPLVQRFDPADQALDSIGFFIAKFAVV